MQALLVCCPYCFCRRAGSSILTHELHHCKHERLSAKPWRQHGMHTYLAALASLRMSAEDLVSMMRLLFWLPMAVPMAIVCSDVVGHSLCLFWGFFPLNNKRVKLFCRTNCISVEREEISLRIHKKQNIIEVSLCNKKIRPYLTTSCCFVYINNQQIDLYLWLRFVLSGFYFSH